VAWRGGGEREITRCKGDLRSSHPLASFSILIRKRKEKREDGKIGFKSLYSSQSATVRSWNCLIPFSFR
jgi:hypothetical protein